MRWQIAKKIVHLVTNRRTISIKDGHYPVILNRDLFGQFKKRQLHCEKQPIIVQEQTKGSIFKEQKRPKKSKQKLIKINKKYVQIHSYLPCFPGM